jgi:hypothetical protein
VVPVGSSWKMRLWKSSRERSIGSRVSGPIAAAGPSTRRLDGGSMDTL